MMPRMISDRDEFKLEILDDNIKSTSLFLDKKPITLKLGNWNLLKAGNSIRLIDNNETLYHVKYQTKYKKFWNCPKQAVQVEVWKQFGTGDLTHGLPKAVFFEYLLKEYGAIVCDYLHTENGKRFWLDRLVEALTNNYDVYYGNYASRELKKVNSRQELISEYQDLCWGDETKHEYRRMAIISSTL